MYKICFGNTGDFLVFVGSTGDLSWKLSTLYKPVLSKVMIFSSSANCE